LVSYRERERERERESLDGKLTDHRPTNDVSIDPELLSRLVDGHVNGSDGIGMLLGCSLFHRGHVVVDIRRCTEIPSGDGAVDAGAGDVDERYRLASGSLNITEAFEEGKNRLDEDGVGSVNNLVDYGVVSSAFSGRVRSWITNC